MKLTKKITALFIAVMMVVSAIPFTASAASKPYLTFTGTESFSIKTNNSTKNWSGTLEYSTDTNTWTTWNGTEINSVNDVLYLRGTGNTILTGSSSSKNWVITTEGTVACSGDIRTLLDYDEPESSSMGTYCFSYLFKDCTSLTAAPELPATILANYCYQYMFYGCTSLTMAPELEATSLALSCYTNMFNGCRSLTTAPELWATTLTNSCYSSMFRDCTSLTTAPELPANDLANSCYYNMFNGCTSLTTPSELPATDLANHCYESMFKGCTGIKLSTEQTAEYSVPYSIPKEGTGTMGSGSLTDMFTGTGGTFTGTPTINTTYYLAAPAPAEAHNGTNITVADTISENFYLDDEFYGADAYIALSYNHNSDASETADFGTDIMALSSLDEQADGDYAGNRIVSVKQAPAQVTEEVTITVYASQADAQADTGAVDTITYSTYDYCRAIIEGDYAANLKALAKSTLDYAAAAQLFFNYNTNDMATKDNDSNAFYNDVAGADLSNVAGPTALATGIEQVSVVVKSDLEINLLSRNKINVTGYELATTNGGTRFSAESIEEKNGDFYVVHIKGIEPANMDNTITVNTDCGDIVMTANSVMKAMAGSSDEKMVTLAKAMYLYGVAANNYFA